MTRAHRAASCERACSWAALAPDGELSELEQALLEAHLRRCSACSRFAAQVAAVAADLRAAALQPLDCPVSVPGWRRRTSVARARTVGAAAAVAAMALGIAARAPLPAGERESFRPAPATDAFSGDQVEQQALRDLRRELIVAAIPVRHRPARRFGYLPE